VQQDRPPQVQNLALFRADPSYRGRSPYFVQLWWLVQATLFRWSPQVLYGLRRWILRFFGAKVGVGVKLRPSVTVTYPWKVTIGDYSMIGDDVVIYSFAPITIGNNVVVSQKSYLCAGTHDFRVPSFDLRCKPIVIEDEVWVATDTFVAPGVTIGRGTVVGARSSVFTDLPPMMICTGSPARPIRPRFIRDGESTVR
jgi:putative colanic acid biosynthesis acetyltransferase WcaF